MRRFLCRTARNGRRVGLALSVALLAGLTGVTTVPSAKAAVSTSGYWLVGTDGGIFSYGAAKFFGSTGNHKLNQPVVGMAATPDGRGYWMVASDGGIFSFGTASFYGSMGGKPLNQPIVGIAATRTGKGYWMVAGDGGIFSFGDASFYGSAVEGGAEKRIVDIASSATGKGYYITASNGAVYAYGDAKFYGGADGQKLAHGIIAMVPINNGEPPVASNDAITVDEDGTAVIDVLANDRDPDGGALSIQSVAPALHGSAAVVDGRISYQPKFNYSGTDTFSYTLIDSSGLTAVGLVQVTINAVDDLPRAVEDAKTVMIGQTVTIDVLGNDGGLGDGLLDLAILPPRPTRGEVTESADGKAIVYTPTKKGSDTIRYRIVDLDGDNAEGVVKLTVEGASPKAVDIGPIECSAGACIVDVVASGASLGVNGRVTMVGESNGTKTVNGVGTFSRQGNVISFAAANGSVGQVEVQYQITDDTETSTPASVVFDYQNSAPIAAGGSASQPANTPTHYKFAAHDPDGDAIKLYVVDSKSGPVDPGPFFTNFNPATGDFDFAAPAGTWTFTFHVVDANDVPSGTATFTITVV